MYGFFQTVFYFGHMALFCSALGVMCGKYISNAELSGVRVLLFFCLKEVRKRRSKTRITTCLFKARFSNNEKKKSEIKVKRGSGDSFTRKTQESVVKATEANHWLVLFADFNFTPFIASSPNFLDFCLFHSFNLVLCKQCPSRNQREL